MVHVVPGWGETAQIAEAVSPPARTTRRGVGKQVGVTDEHHQWRALERCEVRVDDALARGQRWEGSTLPGACLARAAEVSFTPEPNRANVDQR